MCIRDRLDYWVTAGDTPAEIEEHFADAIGKVPMMPEYGLGFWQCKLRYYNQEQVLNVARAYTTVSYTHLIWSFCRSSLVWTGKTQKKIFRTWQTKKQQKKLQNISPA